MNRREAELMIYLGPPSEKWLRDLFDNYQRNARSGGFPEDKIWPDYERTIAEYLFSHDGQAPSPFDELLSLPYDAPVRVLGYELGFGTVRGIWTVCISILASEVMGTPGSDVAWPPNAEIRRVLGSALGELLQREWVFVMAITQAPLLGGREDEKCVQASWRENEPCPDARPSLSQGNPALRQRACLHLSAA